MQQDRPLHEELEEVLPDQEGAADTLEDWSRPAPPPVEPADTPVAPDEMETEEEIARGDHPYLID